MEGNSMKQELDYINTLESSDFLEWNESVDAEFKHRVAMLKIANQVFNSNRLLSELDERERGLFLSKTKARDDDYEFDVNLFGSAGGSGHVNGIISSKYTFFDDFFAAIPRTGKVTDNDYFRLVELFKEASLAAGITIKLFVLFSRMLAITRPDTFVSGAAGKLDLFSKGLGQKKLNNSFDRYWQKTLPALHKLKPFSHLVGNPENYHLALIDGVEEDCLSIKSEVNKRNHLMQKSDSPLNQILYGPPGTGKTYHTIEAAVKAAEPDFFADLNTRSSDIDARRKELVTQYNELVKSKRICFVTFHQSYGYEEFVIGLTARTQGEQIAYFEKDGVFKEICDDAKNYRQTITTKSSDSFLTCWQAFVEQFNNAETGIEFNTVSGKSSINVYDIENDTIRFDKKVGNSVHSMNVKTLKAIFNNERKINGGLQPYYAAMVKYLKSLSSNISDAQIERKNFVLVIDEINRGNISKIFGELITLIEPSKRLGNKEALEVTLPNSDEPFSVPDNLYLIGTMNTADRSLAMMDTALRRRFDFKEMMPNPTLFDDEFGVIEGVNLTLLLSALNKRIEALYDREHTLGHAFLFPAYNAMKAGDTTKAMEALRSAFQNKIIPLLEEYFYEDWSKISLVLGDNQKSDKQPEKQFVRKMPIEYADLFGDDYQADEYGQPESSYKLAPFDDDIWKSAEAYQSIYASLVNTATIKPTE